MLNELRAQLEIFASDPTLDQARAALKRFEGSTARVFVLANGGTFANCEHVAVDWIKQKKINVDIPTSGGLLTCFGNDYGFDNLYSKYLEHKNLDRDSLVIALSSSGASKNILNACTYAEAAGAELWTGWGFEKDRPLSEFGRYKFYVDSKDYNVIEVSHLAILLAL